MLPAGPRVHPSPHELNPFWGGVTPGAFRSGAVHPLLPLTRGVRAPSLWEAGQGPGAHLQLPSLPGRRTGPGCAGNPRSAPLGAWASEAVGAERKAPRPCLDSRSGTGASWSSSCQRFTFCSPFQVGMVADCAG